MGINIDLLQFTLLFGAFCCVLIIFAIYILFKEPCLWGSKDEEDRVQAQASEIELTERFPEKAYCLHSNPLSIRLCSICLKEFTKRSMCRQLDCGHIFHEECIDFWLSQYHACPICNINLYNSYGIEQQGGAPYAESARAAMVENVAVQSFNHYNPGY